MAGPRCIKGFFNEEQLATAMHVLFDQDTFVHLLEPHATARHTKGIPEALVPHLPEVEGYTLAADRSTYNIYPGPNPYHLRYHVDVFDLVYIVNLNMSSIVDFIWQPDEIVAQPERSEDGRWRYYATPLDHETNPPDRSFKLDAGDAVEVYRSDELMGWMHGGLFPQGRISLVLRYDRAGYEPVELTMTEFLRSLEQDG